MSNRRISSSDISGALGYVPLTVSGLPTTGNVLQFNGAAWVPQDIDANPSIKWHADRVSALGGTFMLSNETLDVAGTVAPPGLLFANAAGSIVPATIGVGLALSADGTLSNSTGAYIGVAAVQKGTATATGTILLGAGFGLIGNAVAFDYSSAFPNGLVGELGQVNPAPAHVSHLWVGNSGTLAVGSSATVDLSGASAIAFPSQAKRTVFAAPSGAAGAPTWRQLTRGDVSGGDGTGPSVRAAGRWFRPPGPLSGTATLTAGRLYALPFFLHADTLVHYIGARIATAIASAGTVLFGVYTEIGQAGDALLVGGSTSVAANATGAINIQPGGVPGTTIPAGLVWLAMQANQAFILTAYASAVDQFLGDQFIGFPDQTSVFSTTYGNTGVYSATNTTFTGTLPASFGTVVAIDGAASPALAFRT